MEKQPSKSKKYLLFSMSNRKTGMDNVFRMLNLVFREARRLDRIPVLGNFTMSPTHNLGKSRTDLYFWDYLDLSNGTTFEFKDGYHKPIPFSLEWMKEEELDLTKYTPKQVYTLADTKIVGEKMNQRYDVLIRKDPTFNYVRTYAKYEPDKITIDFPYSDKVNKLTDEVLGVLGISREQAIAAQCYFLNRFSDIGNFGGASDMLRGNIPQQKTYYACVHVRASIKDRDYGQPIFTFGSLKEQISAVVRQTLGQGSRIYIMSDIHRPQFFDFLKPDYEIYRYYDFLSLRKLVSGEGGGKIDNVMLYLVEKNIMKYAQVKILPPHKGPMVYHLNTVYNLSILKDPPRVKARPEPVPTDELPPPLPKQKLIIKKVAAVLKRLLAITKKD